MKLLIQKVQSSMHENKALIIINFFLLKLKYSLLHTTVVAYIVNKRPQYLLSNIYLSSFTKTLCNFFLLQA